MNTSQHGTDANEVEWQFEADDLDRVERWLCSQPPSAALAFIAGKDAVQRDTYMDTDDWDIYRARFSLRIRHSGGEAEATLKALAAVEAGPTVRREISQPLVEGISLLDAEGPVSGRLRLLAGDRELRTMFEVETRRRAFRAEEDGAAVAEIALDDTKVEVDGKVAGLLKRVEVECVGETSGSPLLQSFVTALVEAVELEPATASKFETGLALSGLHPDLPPVFEAAPSIPETSAWEYARSIVRRFAGEMVAHEPGTRLGEDSEELHDMRVALRRLRAALSMFKDVLPAELAELKEDLGWLGRALGEVRDLDVQIEGFVEARAAASWDERNALGELLQVLNATRHEARARLVQTLESERYRSLLLRLEAALAAPPEPTVEDIAVREFVAPILEKRYRRFKKDADELTPQTDPLHYHAVRILGKRLRYSVEFTQPLYGKPADRMQQALAYTQDVLGEHQDAHVVIDWLRTLVRERGSSLTPTTLFYMGEMAAQQRQRMQDRRARWPSAFARVENRWRRLRKQVERGERDEAEDEALESDEPEDDDVPEARSRWPRGWFALIRRRRQDVESG